VFLLLAVCFCRLFVYVPVLLCTAGARLAACFQTSSCSSCRSCLEVYLMQHMVQQAECKGRPSPLRMPFVLTPPACLPPLLCSAGKRRCPCGLVTKCSQTRCWSHMRVEAM
jgi:hypothetical protein